MRCFLLDIIFMHLDVIYIIKVHYIKEKDQEILLCVSDPLSV